MGERGAGVRRVGYGEGEKVCDCTPCLWEGAAVEGPGVGVEGCGLLGGVEAEEAALHALMGIDGQLVSTRYLIPTNPEKERKKAEASFSKTEIRKI